MHEFPLIFAKVPTAYAGSHPANSADLTCIKALIQMVSLLEFQTDKHSCDIVAVALKIH